MRLGVKHKTTFKVGIIGFGGQGKFHFEYLWNIQPFEVSWIFDRHAERIAALPIFLQVFSLKDALCREAQIVVIATPPSSHFYLAQTLLMAGKNVIIEKPTAVSYDETCLLLELAQHRDLFILTYFNRRWDSDFLAVKKALNNYDFGKIHEVESKVTDAYDLCESYPGRKAWKFIYPGGGILLDWAPHLFDQLFELMGRKSPKYVYCHSDRPNRIVDRRLEEQFTIQIKYGKCIAIIGASWNAGLQRPRWLICGTRAAFMLDKPGECNGTIRFRQGNTTLVERFDNPISLLATEEFRTLVQTSMRNRKLLRNEVRRMRMVAYGIDLARSSFIKGKPLKWEL
ncbi:MAG: Gfo/Idh/MocA family oxidoreductase [Deltaproteobacteria bacterium]|nr:Gfo/Idh/MocA family oxidoreductase [Deltaproteobacteria bacterium]